MKKILLGTTALVAATVVTAGVAKAEIGMTGWYYQGFGTSLDADKNTTQNDGLQSYANGDINFTASTELDNGMTMSFKHQRSIVNRSGGGARETNFTLSDDWGSIVMGGDDGAADRMHKGGAWVAGGQALDTGQYYMYASNYALGRAFMTTKNSFIGGDTAQIAYYSPDMSGLTFGVSYTPDGQTKNWSTVGSDGLTNVISASVAYSGDMGGASLGLSGGVEHVNNLNNAGGLGDEDANHYRFGADVGVGGFRVNLGYATTDYATSATVGVDEWTMGGMVSYTVGQHTFAVEAQKAEQDLTIGGVGATEAKNYAVDYSMSIGAGVYWDVHIAWLDVDVPGGTSSDVDATVIQSGVGVSF